MKKVTIYPENLTKYRGFITDLHDEGMAFTARTSLSRPFFTIDIYGKQKVPKARKMKGPRVLT